MYFDYALMHVLFFIFLFIFELSMCMLLTIARVPALFFSHPVYILFNVVVQFCNLLYILGAIYSSHYAYFAIFI